ncbi:MAG: hypothetical protein KGJ13_03210 [Patescibacteria group bacterium]|nr:hypothetical protein [Patescibacteria group bacterium]
MTFEFFTHASLGVQALYAVGYFVACFVSWYFLAAMDYALNSGQLGRDPFLFPFQCFAEELPCYWFGGKRRRVEFIKSRCGGNGTFCGQKRSFTHEEIRASNLCEVVFWEMCGGRFSFWSEHSCKFFLGPFLVLFILLLCLVGLVLLPFRWLYDAVVG